MYSGRRDADATLEAVLGGIWQGGVRVFVRDVPRHAARGPWGPNVGFRRQRDGVDRLLASGPAQRSFDGN
jgi:hypothetical protein